MKKYSFENADINVWPFCVCFLVENIKEIMDFKRDSSDQQKARAPRPTMLKMNALFDVSHAH